MSGVVATFQRELRAYFVSPLAYVILTLFLLINGWTFMLIVDHLNQPTGTPAGSPLDTFFGGNVLFWFMMLFFCPAITMRLWSEERRSGTIEVLMTSPVTESQAVLGKFLAALTFYLFLWLPTVAYPAVLAYYAQVDWGPVAAGYLGFFVQGMLFLSLGMFASALSRSQIIAAVLAFTGMFLLFSVVFLDYLVIDEGVRQVLAHVNLAEHMAEFGRGVVDTRRLVYYLSTTCFFLFLTTRAVSSNKWR